MTSNWFAEPIGGAVEVDASYFDTIGVPIIMGRHFSRQDAPGAPLAIIVSQSFARFIAGSGDPIGHGVTETSWRPPGGPPVARIIGVVPDIVRNVTDPQPMVEYYSLPQREATVARSIVIRTGNDPSRAIADVTP